jgi:hypothetical protein
MDDHLLACQQFLKESYEYRLGNVRASFLKINDINDILFFGTSDYYHCCPIVYVLYVCIYPLSRIQSTSLISAYFGLDSRECV